MVTEYTEIFKLRNLLEAHKIPFTWKERKDLSGYQILFPKDGEDCVCSVIQHTISYGNEDDKLEIQGLLTRAEKLQDSVAGYLSANDVFLRIKSYLLLGEAETSKESSIEVIHQFEEDNDDLLNLWEKFEVACGKVEHKLLTIFPEEAEFIQGVEYKPSDGIVVVYDNQTNNVAENIPLMQFVKERLL